MQWLPLLGVFAAPCIHWALKTGTSSSLPPEVALPPEPLCRMDIIISHFPKKELRLKGIQQSALRSQYVSESEFRAFLPPSCFSVTNGTGLLQIPL